MVPRKRTLPRHLRLGLNRTRSWYKRDGPHGSWELVTKGHQGLRSLHLLNGARSRWLEGPHLLVWVNFLFPGSPATRHETKPPFCSPVPLCSCSPVPLSPCPLSVSRPGLCSTLLPPLSFCDVTNSNMATADCGPSGLSPPP